ncbi:MAG: NAD(P)/FAD-dependent oxidoreductase [Candidatus Acidiferrum sp.]
MAEVDRRYDAVIVGSGPNGLAAAITIAQTGRSVLVLEAKDTIGGSTRSAELTLPGFVHDVCSAVHPMGIFSPFFSALPLGEHGLKWIQPSAPVAHSLDDGSAVIVERSVEATAAKLGVDEKKYTSVMKPLVSNWQALAEALVKPTVALQHPITMARFGWRAMQSASRVARGFRTVRARALFAGMAAHSLLPLEWLPSGAFGLVLGLTPHAVGWPFAAGGSQSIANALASYLKTLGGEIVRNTFVRSFSELPEARAYLFDVSPKQLLEIAGPRFSPGFRRSLAAYQYGPGVCKVDWALSGPIPWTARECARAGTVHIGGTLEEIEESERAPWHGEHAKRPFVLLAQPTLFDAARAPAGQHIAWAYCHVPNGSSVDMSERIENQVERFAPGFRNIVLKRHVVVASGMEAGDPNLIGGDIGGGASDLRQFFLRPTRRLYATTEKSIFLCSASTPPGAGVHGLCGHRAARAALRSAF